MAFTITKTDVYVVDVMNRPGMLARILEALTNAGAGLEFVIARRVTDNTSRIFVAPLQGTKVLRVAADAGLSRATGMHVLRVEGPDRAGLGAWITRGLAADGLNIRGLSAASIGRKCVCYVAFATADELKRAARILKSILRG